MVMVNLGSTDDSRYTGYREITDRDVLDLQCILRSSAFYTFYVDVQYLLNYKAYNHQTFLSASP